MKFKLKKVLRNEIPKHTRKRTKLPVPIKIVIGKASRITIIGISKFLIIVTYVIRSNLSLERGNVLNQLIELLDITPKVSIIVIKRKLKNWSKKKILNTILM
jgi:hypothetical protein